MLRQRLSLSRGDTPKTHNLKKEVEKPILSERKLGLLGLVLSLIIISAKLYYANRDYIQKVIIERRLVSYEVLTEDGQVMLTYAWKNAVKYSRFWLPVLCGFMTSYFTWIMVYLDSNVPGVQPPSPLSPKQYKVQSGHTFHMNYLFSILIGVLVFSYMYWKEVTIQY